MGDKSAIEWCDSTWNPVRGCSLVSAGCTNCYAMRQARRSSGPGGAYEGLTKMTSHGPVWTGKIRTVPELLDQPLRWRRPRRIFVNSMSDLFHEDIPDDFIDRVFAVMALAIKHKFQVLTKRPKRMRDYISGGTIDSHGVRRCYRRDSIIVDTIASDQLNERLPGHGLEGAPWPFPNVWLGVSVEDQETADERIPLLLQTPAAVRWISAEPLLGSIILGGIGRPQSVRETPGPRLDWVVTGGESGPRARPSHPDWFRSLAEQCRAAGVRFFMKQITESGRKIPFEAFPTDLQIREYPDASL